LAWGKPDVDALCQSLTPEQMDEWIAYDALEGINDSWQQTAQICFWIMQSVGAKNHKPADYIPHHPLDRPPKKTITAADDESAMAAQYGGK
jgi:hypothetical protein